MNREINYGEREILKKTKLYIIFLIILSIGIFYIYDKYQYYYRYEMRYDKFMTSIEYMIRPGDQFVNIYALNKILYDVNGEKLFKEKEYGTLIALYRKLGIRISERDDVWDSYEIPYYYIGIQNPPEEFKEKWGHFLVFGFGTDKDRDTYIDQWKEMTSLGFCNDGDYIIYSDKRDFNRFKNSCEKHNIDFILLGESSAKKIYTK